MAKSSKSIEAGGAFVRLFTEDGPLRKGLKSAGGMLKSWGAGFAKVGGVVTGLGASVATPLLAAVMAYSAAGNELSKASQRTGVRTEELSALAYAAEQTGGSVQDLTGALGSMRTNITGAMTGSQGAIDALSKIGLSVRQLRGLSPDEQFRVIADQLSKISDPGLRAAAATGIFGGSAEKLLPLLTKGAKGIRAFEAEAKALGVTMSTEDAQAAEELAGTLRQLWGALNGITRQVGAALAPLLTSVVGKVVIVTAAFGQWIARNRELLLTGFKIVAAVMAVGTALTVLGGSGMALAAVLAGVSTVLGIIGGALSAVGTFAAFLISPLGLILAAVVGLATYSGLAGAALDWLRERFGTLATDAMGAFGAIGKALSAGDIGLAARILWDFLKLEWQRGVTGLSAIWGGVKGWFQSVWAEAVYGAAAIALKAWYGLKTGFMEVVRFLADGWAIFSSGIIKGWHSTIGFIKKAWTRLKAMFSSDINVEAEVKRIDKETAGKNAAADQAAQTGIATRELDAGRKNELARIEQDKKSSLAALQDQKSAESAAREKAKADDLAKSQADLAKAQQDYTKAITEADALPASAAGGSLADRLKGAESRFSGINPTGLASKISSAGSFSAASVRGLGSTNFEQRIASATEATAKWTQATAEKPGAKAA